MFQHKFATNLLCVLLMVTLISIMLYSSISANESNTHGVAASTSAGRANDFNSAPVDMVPLTDIVQLSAGDSHTCALTTQGGVKCWGYNHSGRLGDGTTTPRLTATDVVGLASSITAISAGYDHTCALTLQGGVKCWGNNDFGQLGDSTTISRLTPVEVVSLSTGVTAISAGGRHTCALTSLGGIKCWGKNSYTGQLGDGTTIDRHTPVDVSGLTSGVIAIAAGYGHTCAVTEQGGAKCWGDGEFGQLGNGSDYVQYTPVDVRSLSSGITTIVTYDRHTCALTTEGGVKCWGDNGSGQLGDDTDNDHFTPVDVSGLTQRIIAITVGRSHTCALTIQNSVECWGSNHVGQLGDDAGINQYTPHAVPSLTSDIVALSAGRNHTCALENQGGVKCWGSNIYGELGNGASASHVEPIETATLSSTISTISTSFLHTCVVTTDGGAKCWGRNYEGQLGDDTTTDRLAPADVIGLTDGVIEIAAGYEYSCALTALDGVKCWGSRGSGQLGDGSGNDQLTPVAVSGLASGVSTIVAGGYHACALTTEGGIKCWGDNKAGQLGDGTNDDRQTSVNVVGLTTDISAISAGLAHTCAIDQQQAVKCWGDNRAGQLGVGSTVASNIPVAVTNLISDTVKLASGAFHTCALSSEGNVKCWGNNNHGQLGDGTTTSHQIPVDVAGLNRDVIAITAGREHTCALTSHNGIKCWGNNTYGQLGDGTTSSRQVPTDVVGLDKDMIAVTTGFSHTCALTVLGDVKCWGANHYGQLGDGSVGFYPEPSNVLVTGISTTPTATTTPTVTPGNTPTTTFTPTTLPTNTVIPTHTPTTTVVPTSTPSSTPTNSPGIIATIAPEGGTVSGELSRETELHFPPGGVEESIEIIMMVDEDPPTTEGFQVLGQPFRIEARTMSGVPVTQFQQPFTLVVHLTSADLQGMRLENLAIHYFDPTQAEWIAISSMVDTTAQTVTASLNHLTQFAVLASEKERIYLPFTRR